MTTATALAALRAGTAPRITGTPLEWPLNQWVVCSDGFTVSVQASGRHRCADSDGSMFFDRPPVLPWTEFEVSEASAAPEPRRRSVIYADGNCDGWDFYRIGEGIWGSVPEAVIAALLDSHGGAVGWTDPT